MHTPKNYILVMMIGLMGSLAIAEVHLLLGAETETLKRNIVFNEITVPTIQQEYQSQASLDREYPAEANGAHDAKPTIHPSTEEYKVALLTGTKELSDEEYTLAESLARRFPKLVVHQTFGDNSIDDSEAMAIGTLVLLQDKSVKALIVAPSVSGAINAFNLARRDRPDVLLVSTSPWDDLSGISPNADAILMPNELGMGISAVRQAKLLGARTFLHYGCSRHMSYPLLSQRRQIMQDECDRLGIAFIHAAAPDPLGDEGTTGTTNFIESDVPAKILQYGADTAFFATSCAMQEPLIRKVIAGGAIFVQQCCPGPLHGYTEALGIAIPEDPVASIDLVNAEIKKKIVALGASGRASAWPLPAGWLMVESAFAYARKWIEDGMAERCDIGKMSEIVREIAGTSVDVQVHRENGISFPNCFLIDVGHITY